MVHFWRVVGVSTVAALSVSLLLPACSDSASGSDAGDASPAVDSAVADAADAAADAADATPVVDASKDPTTSCQDMCKGSGFGGSRVDIQPNELNCFCTSGAGEVTEARCTTLCTGQGKPKAQRFKSTGATFDACQCS